jgi:hypothetical protein
MPGVSRRAILPAAGLPTGPPGAARTMPTAALA